MKNRAVFVALWLMNFMAGIAFCSWGHHIPGCDGEFLILYLIMVLYLGAGHMALMKWEMDL